MTGSLDPALLNEESARIEQVLQLLRGFLRQPNPAQNVEPGLNAGAAEREEVAVSLESMT